MYFFKSAETLDGQCCAFIFEVTATVLKLIQDFNRNGKLSQICARVHLFAALLGTSLMLRILKGPFAPFVDQELGSALYLSTVQFMKSCSIEKGDLPDRVTTFAEQTWSSKRIFKEDNGGIALRVRNRLSTSPLYDAMCLWKEEVSMRGDSAGRTMETSTTTQEGSGPLSTNGIQSNASPENLPTMQPLLIDELWEDLGFSLDCNWGLSDSGTSWIG
jgi:hypothetical protein